MDTTKFTVLKKQKSPTYHAVRQTERYKHTHIVLNKKIDSVFTKILNVILQNSIHIQHLTILHPLISYVMGYYVNILQWLFLVSVNFFSIYCPDENPKRTVLLFTKKLTIRYINFQDKCTLTCKLRVFY